MSSDSRRELGRGGGDGRESVVERLGLLQNCLATGPSADAIPGSAAIMALNAPFIAVPASSSTVWSDEMHRAPSCSTD